VTAIALTQRHKLRDGNSTNTETHTGYVTTVALSTETHTLRGDISTNTETHTLRGDISTKHRNPHVTW